MAINDTKSKRYDGIDWLRAIAALAVCGYHFTDFFIKDSFWSKELFKYGYLGVQAFFVISGFTVLYSLEQKKYRASQIIPFIKKRALRIEPGYWLSILLMLCMDLPGRLFLGNAINTSPLSLCLHLFHANAVLGFSWLRDLYWTLAIDWQFFGLMCIAFSAFVHQQVWLRYLSLSAFVALHWFSSPSCLFYHSFSFAAGMMLFYFYTSKCSLLEFCFAMFTLLILDYKQMGITHPLAIGGSVLIIMAFQYAWSPVQYMSQRSYSFYLTHLFIGWILCTSVSFLIQNNWIMTGMIGLSVYLNILFSDFFYQKLELPLQAWLEKKWFSEEL
jgi:peptidoglycan/LPS O-acetylase OafA/YrhL